MQKLAAVLFYMFFKQVFVYIKLMKETALLQQFRRFLFGE